MTELCIGDNAVIEQGSSLSKRAIANSFGHAAASYDGAAHFQRWAGLTLLDRLSASRAQTVLDLGAGTGYFLKPLQQQFKPDLLLSADLSEGMMAYAKTHQPHAQGYCVADADALPFAAESFDLVFSSLAIQWCYDLPHLFAQIHRILKPGACFAFTTLFDGSLRELKQAWAEVDLGRHVNAFFGLSSYQDAITNAGFEIEFLDTETKVLSYSKVQTLTRELKDLGAHNVDSNRHKGLGGRAQLKAFIAAYEAQRRSDGTLPASYETGFGLIRRAEK